VRAGAGLDGGALPALRVARRGGLRRQGALGDALRLRGARGKTMSHPRSDALVFYGATGDLAFKKIFPALHRMVRAGTLDCPVIGIAGEGWSLERLRERARESVETHGDGVDADAFPRLMGLLRYVEGDYESPATFDSLRVALGAAQRPVHYMAIPPALF